MKYDKDIIIKDNDICVYFKYLEWDSGFFKVNSYMLDLDQSNLKASSLVKSEIESKLKDSFVSVKLDTNSDFQIVSLLQDYGFKYIDTEVTLEFKDSCLVKEKGITNNVYVTKEIANANLPYKQLGDAFSLTRFHADTNIPSDKADELWVNYLKNYNLSERKHMFTAKVKDEIAGVILVDLNNKVATLAFVSIIDGFRGLGVGTVLINKVIESFPSYTIRTGTQVKNINALNFYISNGFSKIYKTSTVLHRW